MNQHNTGWRIHEDGSGDTDCKCKNTSLFSSKAVIDAVVFKAVVNYRETNHRKNHCGLQVLQMYWYDNQ